MSADGDEVIERMRNLIRDKSQGKAACDRVQHLCDFMHKWTCGSSEMTLSQLKSTMKHLGIQASAEDASIIFRATGGAADGSGKIVILHFCETMLSEELAIRPQHDNNMHKQGAGGGNLWAPTRDEWNKVLNHKIPQGVHSTAGDHLGGHPKILPEGSWAPTNYKGDLLQEVEPHPSYIAHSKKFDAEEMRRNREKAISVIQKTAAPHQYVDPKTGNQLTATEDCHLGASGARFNGFHDPVSGPRPGADNHPFVGDEALKEATARPDHLGFGNAYVFSARSQQTGNGRQLGRKAWEADVSQGQYMNGTAKGNTRTEAKRRQEQPESQLEEVDISEMLFRQFRNVVLKRGSGALHNLSKTIRLCSRNLKPLDGERLQMLLRQFGINLPDKDALILCAAASRDDSYSPTIVDFTKALYGSMSPVREQAIDDVWDKLDRNHVGKVSMDVVAAKFDPSGHPDAALGRLPLREAHDDFLSQFDDVITKDGCLPKREFFEYYASVSADVKDDQLFDHIMKSAWPQGSAATNGPGRPVKSNNVLVTFKNGRQSVIALEKDLGKDVHNEDFVKRQLKKQGVSGVATCVPTH